MLCRSPPLLIRRDRSFIGAAKFEMVFYLLKVIFHVSFVTVTMSRVSMALVRTRTSLASKYVYFKLVKPCQQLFPLKTNVSI